MLKIAVFPVAGFGTRFLPATKACPKEMLPVVDKPLIQYAVEEAYAAGLRTMVFITGRNKWAITEHYDRAYELESELERRGQGELLRTVQAVKPRDMDVIYIRQEQALGLGHAEMADIFATWNTGDLDSYLIEITAEVLRKTDPRTGVPLVDVIRDAAGMKGTGTWTVQSALDLGTPVNTIAESVFARAISSSPELRTAARAALHGPDRGIRVADRDVFVEQVRQALWASKVVAYAQGLDEIRMAAAEYGWSIDIAEVARIWRAGCIIRARLLERIRSEYAAGNLVTLLEAPSIVAGLTEAQEGWRTVVAEAVRAGVPVPGFSAALAHYDQARAPRLNAALTQGLRDYFGAHTYRRIDDEGAFHINWSTDGAEVAAD